MDKSPDAFRTISEVAEYLDTPAHVLRFWESRFPQIKPVKRAGGRRYYRPADVALLGGIKRLLHNEGLTIRGVQKILRDQGVRHVAGLTDDSVGIDDLISVDGNIDLPEEVPEAGFIEVDDLEPEPVILSPSPRVPAEQSVLPLFDTPPALARTEPARAVPALKPTLNGNVTFGSLIRALPRTVKPERQQELAELARRLTTLRDRMAARAEGGNG